MMSWAYTYPKMMLRNIFIPILAFASLAGCEQERVVDLDRLQDRNGVLYEVNATEGFTGTVIAGRYENGQKKGEATLRDGKLHGIATDFYWARYRCSCFVEFFQGVIFVHQP